MRTSDTFLQVLGKALRPTLFACTALALMACQQESGSVASAADAPASTGPVLQVMKDPSCGCCEGWISHVQENGFMAQISHPQDLSAQKMRLGIAPQYQSCHTAVSEEGYVFEGHIPANVVSRFLDEHPDALGLAVPGMPLGSPGMEIGGQFHPYDVLQLNKDGSSQVYAHIASQDEQY